MYYALAFLVTLYLTCQVIGDAHIPAPKSSDSQTSSSPPPTALPLGQWQGNRFVGQLSSPLLPQASAPIPVAVSGPEKIHRRIDAQSLNTTGERGKQIFEDIFGKISQINEDSRRERIQQMNQWLSDRDSNVPVSSVTRASNNNGHKVVASPLVLSPLFSPIDLSSRSRDKHGGFQMLVEESRIDEDLRDELSPLGSRVKETRSRNAVGYGSRDRADIADRHADRPDRPELPELDDEPIPHDEDALSGGIGSTGAGSASKQPPCAHGGRFYCSYKEDYPIKVVTEVARYYKWPLEKLFRDLRQQVMPKLANDNYGGLVCDSVTRVVRPGWARNTANRWLVVINTDNYQQFVTEVVCRNGQNAPCNFIPPCYSATCTQRYNTQKLMVIDPTNPYKGPFMSEFLFPSCCICYVPSYAANDPHIRPDQSPAASSNTSPFADRLKKGGPDAPKAEL